MNCPHLLNLDMNSPLSPLFLQKFYGYLLAVSTFFTAYSFLKPGIYTPVFPSQIITVLSKVGTSKLTSSKKLDFNKDSSDRKLSPIYKLSYDDGTSILATMVRVRKRDDFKIETYGLLTKNIDPVYLKNSTFIDSIPPSQVGSVGQNKYIQTCVIPGSTKLSDSDFRLVGLTTTVERLNPRKKSLLNKFLGTVETVDYSCLVLTYQYPSNSKLIPPKNWPLIVSSVQSALIKKN